MYKPHFCVFTQFERKFDEKRNPITSNTVKSEKLSCYLDLALPDQVVYSQDGQAIRDASGVIYLSKGELSKLPLPLKEGSEVLVTDKKTDSVVFKGLVKTFNSDLFHDRIWV